ncbi:PIN domain-containing protein [Defluviimonas aestuarii]|uniref:type II toxin-antitoxin system VapC family toxin n=1 Tax=Albidovulum aestuarii TaxID=1130726 RepID=UPI00249ADC43|nr:PIN domain-containing protein [Defluviimonas aestuarii]MDI3335656.1 PIN domain-containing protein [Defluviimonas aestuarii]
MSDQTHVYMDACCFIEAVKSDASISMSSEREGEVWYIKKLLQAHRDREITVYTSVISIAEAVHAGTTPVPDNVQRGLEALLTSGQYVHLVQATPFICIDARNLRWVDGLTLKGADSVHLASAIDRSCAEFLTLDGRFERVEKHRDALSGKGLSVALPSQGRCLPEKYLQGSLLDGQQIQ